MKTAAAWALGALLSGYGCNGLAAGEPTPEYHISRTVELGAPDRWDYVVYDPDSHRVYVAHGDRLSVVDGDSGAITGQVKGFPGGTHGIAIVGAAGLGYTDDGRQGEAGSFDLKTLQVRRRIRTDPDADAIVFDQDSNHAFVVNGDSGTLTVIDPTADAAIGRIVIGGELEYAVSDSHGKLYVNGAERQEVVRVDTHSNAVVGRWPVPGCRSPHGLAIDTDAQRLFVTCLNETLVVLDTRSGARVATLPIGRGTDAAVFDPARKLIFSSNGGDGTLSIIREADANTFVPLGSIRTAITGRTMAIDVRTGRLYVAAADVVAEPKSQRPTPPGTRPQHPAIAPGSLKLLFLDPGR